MNPYDGQQPVTARRRRTERNSDSYMNEPSMSAPQQMPPARNAVPRPVPHSAAQPSGPVQPMRPVQPGSAGYPGQTPSAAQRSAVPPQSMYMPAPQGNGVRPQTQPQQTAYPGGYRQQQGYVPYGQQYQQSYGWQEQPAQPQGREAWQQQPYYAAQQNWQGYEQQESGYAASGGYVPPSPPVKGARSGGGQPPKKNLGKLLIGLIALAVVFVVITLVSNGNRQKQQNNDVNQIVAYYEDRYCEGVHVNGIHLGGMTQAEANRAVSESVRQQLDDWKVRLTLDGMLAKEVRAADVGMTIDIQAALDAAWAQGHTATDAAGRKTEMDLLSLSHFYTETAAATFDAGRVDAILTDLAARVYRAPVDGYLKEFNAQMISNPFVVEEGQNGAELNVAAAREEILRLASGLENGTVALEVTVIPATVQSGASEIALRGSAYTAISTTSTVERTANIKRAFELITGTVLKPGESFSFNNIVGARNAKNGFFQAIEYAYGTERMGYGGGVCQASTTMYLAAVRANLEIVKREQHSDKVNYTDYGLDATVNLDGKKIDFVFKNNTASDIYIVASVQLDRKIDKNHYIAKVDIYGEPLEDGVTYDLVAETVEILPPPVDPEFKEDENATYVTYIDEEKSVRKASEGYVVETFKVKYLNGVEMDRTYMYRDTYKAKAELVYVGVSERE